MRWSLALLVVALAFLPAASARVEPIARLDVFEPVDARGLEYSGGCGQPPLPGDGEFRVARDGAWFAFDEGNASSATPGGLPPQAPPLFGGEVRSNCGTATLRVPLEEGVEHVHVRFDADRRITSRAPVSIHMPQRVTVTDPGGRVLGLFDYFQPGDGPSPRRHFDLPPVPTSGLEEVVVSWYFEDQGVFVQQGTINPASGQVFEATVWDVVVERSGVHRPVHAMRSDAERESGHILRTYQADVEVTAADYEGRQTNVRVRAHGGLEFLHVIAPDGTIYQRQGTFGMDEPYGPDLNRTVVERASEDVVEVTLPADVVQRFGVGTYTFVFQGVITEHPVAALVPLNGLLLALPLVLAGFTFVQVRAFQREAFGAFARSARNLMLALGLIIVYYLTVVATAWGLGWVQDMSVLPLQRMAILTYAQVGAALMAFLALFFVGRELHKITKPG